MFFRRASVSEPKYEPEVEASARACGPFRVSPASILIMSIWFGLVAGYFDLAMLLFKKRWLGDPFVRLSHHFVWIIPLAVTALVLVPGIVLAIFAGLRRRAGSLRLPVTVLAFVGVLDVAARLPLELWASLLFSGGLAVQAGHLARRRPETLIRIVRKSLPLLVGGLVLTIAFECGWSFLAELRATGSTPPAPTGARNVLLVVWDTVRVDNLSLHGYARDTSPNLAQLARRGVRFDQAFATAPWTLPSHASLFTGRWPHTLSAGWFSPLDDAKATLAEYLASQGYDTAGFVANLDYCSRETGLSRGFAHYEDYPIAPFDVLTRYVGLVSRLDLLTPASVINRFLKSHYGEKFDAIPRAKEHAKDAESIDGSFLNWLTWQQTRARPFFAFLNYNDAHSPYEVPDRSVEPFGLRPVSYVDRLTLKSWETIDKTQVAPIYLQMAVDLYDESVRYLDRRLGILIDDLKRRGVLDHTLLVIVSDHGEHLGDHRLFFHGCSLYRQVTQVPLVIVAPARVPAGHIVDAPASLRDLPATIVDLLGFAESAPFPGRSLARHWAGEAGGKAGPGAPLLLELEKPIGFTNQGREPVAFGPMKGIVADGMHYIRRGDGAEELFFLKPDPAETNNLAGHALAAEPLRRFREILSGLEKEK
jgi:arylsulfatase A-like enzyme